MKKFEFRLQPVLMLREQAEKTKQREFAVAVRFVRKCENDILFVLEETQASQEELRKAEMQSIDPWQLIFQFLPLSPSMGRVAHTVREG